LLTVRTGLPCPDLESALRAELKEHAARGDFSRLALIVPSRETRRGLRLLIGREWGLSCLGLHLLTAYDFALEILAGSEDRPAHIAPQGLLAVLVRELVRSGSFAELGPIAETHGGPGALLASMRTLYEAGVPAGRSGGGKVEILRLYSAFEAERKQRGLAVPADAAVVAAGCLTSSPFLKQLSGAVYWGFYDMTGVQLGLLQALAQVLPVSFYLPAFEAPAGEFSAKFLESALAPIANQVVAAPLEPVRSPLEPAITGIFGSEEGLGSPPELPVRITSVSGGEAELRAAAREVLRLAEEGDGPVPFDQIAVVARSLESYAPWLESVFGEHCIPFRCSGSWPGGAFPVVKAVHALLRAIENGYSRSDVMDLLASPFFAAERFGAAADWASYWDALTRDRGVVGGEDWKGLDRLARVAARRQEADQDAEYGRAVPLDAGKIDALRKAVGSLIKSGQAIPLRGGWGQLGAAFIKVIDLHLHLDLGAGAGVGAAEGPDAGLSVEVRRVVQGMRDFSAASSETTRAEFFGALRDELNALGSRLGARQGAGVEVLDAMSLRGRSFRGIVLVGTHEGAFPRPVRQDPFLPDLMRGALSAAGGSRVPLKEAAYLEERLLFALTLGAARERLSIVQQRSDDEGKPLVPSWYLQELRRVAANLDEGDDILVPRRLQDRVSGERKLSSGCLSGPERLRGLVLCGVRARAAWKQLASDPVSLARCLEAADELAATGAELTARDGITGPLDWVPPADKLERGLSATYMEMYAGCPFRFFAERGLGLAPIEEPEDVEEVGALEYGSILHQVLQLFFESVIESGELPAGKSASKLGDDCLREAFSGFVRENPTGWPLLWKRAEKLLRDLSRMVISEELSELAKSDYLPVGVELEAAAALPDGENIARAVRGLHLYGRIDRLDARGAGAERELRVVDYKYKSGASNSDGKLTTAAVRGRRLQPPIYVLLAGAAGQAGRCAGAEFHYIAPNWSGGNWVQREFPGDCWATPLGAQVAGVLELIVGGIRRGEFFVMPDDQRCKYCDFAGLCRKGHRATRYRHAVDPRPEPLAWLGKAKAYEKISPPARKRNKAGS
jgi:ATP-dependent helicase/nuclease subunit B